MIIKALFLICAGLFLMLATGLIAFEILLTLMFALGKHKQRMPHRAKFIRADRDLIDKESQ